MKFSLPTNLYMFYVTIICAQRLRFSQNYYYRIPLFRICQFQDAFIQDMSILGYINFRISLFRICQFQDTFIQDINFRIPLFRILSLGYLYFLYLGFTLLSLFRIPLFRMPLFRIPLFKIPLFRIPLFRIPLFRILLFRIPLFRILLFRILLFRIVLFRIPLFRICQLLKCKIFFTDHFKVFLVILKNLVFLVLKIWKVANFKFFKEKLYHYSITIQTTIRNSFLLLHGLVMFVNRIQKKGKLAV